MTTVLVNTVRTVVAAVQYDDDCPVQLAAIQPLKDYIDNLQDTPLYIVTRSVLCFKNANDRRQYVRSKGDLLATSVQTVMKAALQYRVANILRLFLCASLYRTTSVANTADQQYCVLVLKLEQHQHIYTTRGVSKEDIARGAVRIYRLQGIAVVEHLLGSYTSRQRATVYMKDGAIRRCIQDSLEAVVEVFEAAVVYGLLGREILEYNRLMQGRTEVTVTLQGEFKFKPLGKGINDLDITSIPLGKGRNYLIIKLIPRGKSINYLESEHQKLILERYKRTQKYQNQKKAQSIGCE